MKISVDIDVDWIGEDGSIDETISSKIREDIVKKIYKKLEDVLLEKIKVDIEATLDEKIMKTYDDFLSKEFTIYDHWGDKKEKKTVKDVLKEKFDKFMTEKVDEYGRKEEYNGQERYKIILDKELQNNIDLFIRKISSFVLEGIKKDINAEAQKRISQAILSDYDLKKIIR